MDGTAGEAGPGGREDSEPEAGRHLPLPQHGRRLQDCRHLSPAQSWKPVTLHRICISFFQGMVGLSKALRVFEDEGLNLVHIESRKVKGNKDKVLHYQVSSIPIFSADGAVPGDRQRGKRGLEQDPARHRHLARGRPLSH